MDHDRLFKKLITTFFTDLIDLFAPDLSRHIDHKSIEFLDKEIFSDIAAGERREVDLLVKAKFHGKAAFLLIHVENQARSFKEFSERMFLYFAHLYSKYRLPVYPIVIFSYDQPLRAAEDRFQITFPGRQVLDFCFHVVQLNRLNWRDFIEKPNPIASALMVKMNIAAEDRPLVKLECLRMILKLRLDKARSNVITTFMENYLKLTAEENVVYNSAMATISPKEKQEALRLTSPWGHDKAYDIVVRLLERRFGKPSKALRDRIWMLGEVVLDELAVALLDFKSIKDADRWVTAHRDK